MMKQGPANDEREVSVAVLRRGGWGCAAYWVMVLICVCAVCGGESAGQGGPSTAVGIDDGERVCAGRTLREWRQVMKSLDPRDAGSSAYVPGMVQLVEDESIPWFTRRQAALTLGRIGAPAAKGVPVLVTILSEKADTSGDETAAVWALKGLALFGPVAREATPAVVAILEDPRRGEAERLTATETLAKIGGSHPQAIPALIRQIEGHPARSESDAVGDRLAGELQQAAIESVALAGAAGRVAVPALIRILQSDSAVLRSKAAAALGSLGPLADQAIPMLAELMVLDESDEVRDRAELALSAIGEASVGTLVGLLKDREAEVRMRAADALGRMKQQGAGAADALRERTEDDSALVRAATWQAWGEVTGKPEEAAIPLAMLLGVDEHEVRQRVLRWFKRTGNRGETARGALMELARDPRTNVRRSAEQVLGSLGKR